MMKKVKNINTYSKITASVLVAVLVLCAVSGIAAGTAYDQQTGSCSCGGTYTNGFCSNDGTHYQAPEGEGTAEKPYEIANAGNLYWFAAQANASTDEYEGDLVYAGCAVLTADIVVNPGTFAANGTYTPAGTESAKEWIPIADNLSGIIYIGTFDGQGHSISGLYYDRNCEDDDGYDRAGLFGWVHFDGTVKNVTVQSSYFKATMYLGAIVGSNNGTVKNCHGRDNYLVGVSDTIDSTCIGGVVGANYGTLDQLSNIGGAVSGKEYIGGVIGYSYGDILNCYNTAPVTGTNAVGGVVGYAECQNIRFCYNIGTISCDNGAGSIVGHKEDEITFRGCYYQVAEGLDAIGNSTVADGITPMTKEEFDSGKAAGQIREKWGQYVDEFNKAHHDVRLKEEGWFADPVTKLPAFDGDLLDPDGTIFSTRPSAGNGTAADPYQIDSYLDLRWFCQIISKNFEDSLCAKLTADIVANPGTFDANGSYTPGEGETGGMRYPDMNVIAEGYTYIGTFDGQGHTISGLYYKNQSDQGLFYNIGAGGTVKNVIIANSYFGNDEDLSVLGAIAAYNYGTVENCGVLDSVYFNASNTTSGVVGGVVGTNYSGGTVKNCFSAASVSGVGTCGGVVGSNAGKVENCYYLQAEGLSGIENDTAEGNTTTAVTDFSTGEVTYKLNGDQSAIVWYQTLGTDGDKYPVLDSKHGTVYLRSDGSYGNSATVECTHQYENGICTKCDAYQKPDADILGNTYSIANAGNLYWFAAQVNSGNTGINAILTADITVNENVLGSGNLTNGTNALRRWTPIGDSSNKYTGFFDGDGHTISGLYYYNGTPSADNAYYVGLFGYVDGGASIEDVGLIDSYFCVNDTASGTTGVYLGGIVACAYNKVTISDCHSGAVLYVNNYSGALIGGIVGYVKNPMAAAGSLKVRDCYNTGDLYGYGGNTLGGIVGYADVGNSITVSGCYNTGTLSGGENSNVGGTVGVINAGSSSITVSDCYNTGKLSGDPTSSNVGGAVGTIVGIGGRSTICNCYNAGNLSGMLCGGVAGYAYKTSALGSIAVNNCYFTNTDQDALGKKNALSASNISVNNTTAVIADAVASGEVAYLLNNERSTSVWKQGKDGPAFKGDDVGYNSESDSYVLSHTYVDGACNVCGAICAHGTVEGERCTICGCTYAAEVQFATVTKKYFTVNEAFAAVINDATITLLRDAKIQSTIEIGNKDANITLIGGEYTLSAECTIFKITKGTLTVQSGTYITTGGNVFYISGVATVPGSSSSGSGSEGAITTPDFGKGDVVTDIPGIGTGDIPGIGTTTTATDSGTVKIEGGTFTSNSHTVYIARDTKVSQDESTLAITTYTEKGKAEIGGGTFTSTGGYAIYVGTESIGTAYLGGDLIVSGGAFNGGLYIVNKIAGIESDDISVKLSGGSFDRIDYNKKADILQQYYAYFAKDDTGAYTVLTAAADVGANAVQVKLCTHVYTKADGACDLCGKACDHPAWNSATCACTTCGYVHVHSDYDEDGFCTVCRGGYEEPTLNSDGYYEIDNAGKLYWFAARVNSGYAKINAKVTKNITVNASVLTDGKLPDDTSALRQWTPIGNETNAYKGTFDGQNHTISGLFYSGSDEYVGLFGCIGGGAVIQNVGVIDSCFQVSGNYRFLGGIVGYADANDRFSYAGSKPITISGCSSAAVLTSTANNAYVGGVVGWVSTYEGSVTIQNCSNTGKITATSASDWDMLYSGGVVGSVGASQGNVTIQNCFNTGEITATSTYNAYCGGVAGNVSASQGNVTIQNCFSTGAQNVNANVGVFSGGVAGYVIAYGDADNQGKGTLSNCYYAYDTAASACGGEDAGDGAKVTTDKVERMTEEEFASGKVAWLLNGKSSDDDVVWKQTLAGAEKMAVPGFTGRIVIYDDTADTYGNAPFVSVTITWTSMEFTYTDGAWNANTHSYDDGAWSTVGGTVTIENGGNVTISLSFAYTTDRTDIGGNFTKPSFNLVPDASDTTALKLSGKPSTSLDNAAIGTITITIAQAKQG